MEHHRTTYIAVSPDTNRCLRPRRKVVSRTNNRDAERTNYIMCVQKGPHVHDLEQIHDQTFIGGITNISKSFTKPQLHHGSATRKSPTVLLYVPYVWRTRDCLPVALNQEHAVRGMTSWPCVGPLCPYVVGLPPPSRQSPNSGVPHYLGPRP